jgi:hypothetical protein
LYYAKTGDVAYKEAAFRTYNWVTYFQGLSGAAHAPFSDQWWFTDEFADGPRRMMDALWAVPEWAPADESHLLGSISVVTKIAYGAGSVTYSTFDADSTDVLRLNFTPEFVMVGGKPIQARQHLDGEGYKFDQKTRTMTIHHVTSRDVDIQGGSDKAPPIYVTFDNPHIAAGSVLAGQYPSGVIDWGKGEWAIGTPGGKFGTFTLVLADEKAVSAGFAFYAPRIFAGIDIYNGGEQDAIVTIHSPETRKSSFTIKPKEIRRLRTEWRDPSSRIEFELVNGEGLRFDNLAYVHP